MKPVVLFGVTFAILAGGTVWGRFTGGGNGDVAAATLASWPPPNVPERFSAEGATRLGDFPLGEGEAPALRSVAQSVKAYPGLPVVVEWTETFKKRQVTYRARYSPTEQTLQCERKGEFYSYAPVTQGGIEASLRQGTLSPFANAHLFSLPAAAFH